MVESTSVNNKEEVDPGKTRGGEEMIDGFVDHLPMKKEVPLLIVITKI